MSNFQNDIQRAKQALPLPDLLRHYNLGDRAKKSARSPFRDGDNPSAFGIFQKDNGDWNWKDFVTGDFGDEIDFIAKYENRSNEDAIIKFLDLAGVKREATPIPQSSSKPVVKLPRRFEANGSPEPTPQTTSFDWNACVESFFSKAPEIAQWRGFSVDFVESLRTNRLIGLHEGHVAFPVMDDDGTVIGCHYRLEDGTWRFEPKGTHVAPLIIGDPANAKNIFVFESQWDALAVADKLGWHEGRMEAAFIITRGASNGRLVAGLLNPKAKVTVWPQNDKPKKNGKIPAEEWLQDVIKAADGHHLYRVEIPTEHKDANDWIRAGVDDKTLWNAIASAKKTRKSKLPTMRDLSTIIGDNIPPEPPQLVQGILHQGSKLIIGGTSKGRKTFSLLDLAISVQSGSTWWGHQCSQGRVCYINFEIQEPFFARRIEAIANAKNVPIYPGMLMGWTLRGHVDGIEKMVEDLLDELMDEKFALIIFDPIYKALGERDENKAGDVASMLNELEFIAVQTGAAIAFGAHYSKGNQASKESIDRIGGSGVFARDPDSILTMTAHEQEDCFTVDATLRNFPPIEPFVLHWQWPLFHNAHSLDPADLKQSPGGRPKKDDSPILDALSNAMTFTEWLKNLDPDLYSKADLANAIRRLAKAGLIRKTEQGFWVKINRQFGL
jgi:hypothetical protein